MCNVFFNADSIDDIAHNGEKDDPENLDLRYYQTAGGMLLHELMHTLEITGTGKDKREHIADLTFNNGRRIYGPVDVAKAARVYGAFETRLNADSFTQFVSAIYWQKRKGARHPPKPSIESSVGTLEEWQEALSDSSGNYFDTCLEPPKDFNCNCGEGGCSADSLPCCASGSCKCNCNESGCGRTDPACCASGTCKF
jgi:hypothetical protein